MRDGGRAHVGNLNGHIDGQWEGRATLLDVASNYVDSRGLGKTQFRVRFDVGDKPLKDGRVLRVNLRRQEVGIRKRLCPAYAREMC